MIDFTDVRIEKETTYTFISNANTRRIDWMFEDAGITDYEIISLVKIRNQLPDHVVVPEKVLLVPGDPLGHPCRRPCVLISHMNPEDLNEKLIELHYTDDPQIKARDKAIRDAAMIDFKQNYEPYL